VHRLDRVYDDKRSPRLRRLGKNGLDLSLNEQAQALRGDIEPLRTQIDLRRGFLAARIEHTGARGRVRRDLQQQR